MTLLSRRFKLEYNDAVDGTTVIAETGQDTGALKIDRHVQIRRQKDPDILKLWLEGTNFGQSIPTRKSEFGQAQNQTDEPEILYKQYDPDSDSFVTQGRYYAKNTGTINENGELALKLYSFYKFTARQSVDTPVTTTNVEDALNEVLPQGYVAQVPGSATPPSVDGYTINARREKGYHELTRDYKWTLTFTGNLDGNNDYLVKYEPEGFGGTVDTLIENTQAGSFKINGVLGPSNAFTVVGDVTNLLVVNQAIQVVNSDNNDGTYTIDNLSYDSNNNTSTIEVVESIPDATDSSGKIIPGGQAVFKSWEKDKTDAIINKVLVEGTRESDGATVTGEATNDTQIQNFGEKFLKVKRGYVESQSDAENIAEGYLVPGLDENGDDITKVPENGTVKTSVYSDNVVNDSFQVVGNERNIDDTYTVAQQRNFWPEGATEIEFEFEQENLEEAARNSENLRDERGRLYPSQQTDVGGQNFTADTGSAPSDTNVAGGVDNERISSLTRRGVLPVDRGAAVGGGGAPVTITLTAPSLNQVDNATFGGINWEISLSNRWKTAVAGDGDVDWEYEIINLDTGTTLDSGFAVTLEDDITIISGGASDSFVSPGDDIEIQFEAVNGTTFSSTDSTGLLTTLQFQVDPVINQSHGDNFDTNDNQHGGQTTIDRIIDVDTSNNIFTVQGDQTADYSTSSLENEITVVNSTSNDGNYTISSVSIVNGDTEITVSENVSDSTADGYIIPEKLHGAFGDTESQNINTASEEKTDR